MAVGALSAVASIRWAVGQWEKGKKKWWEDWHRVGEGLDRDLRVSSVVFALFVSQLIKVCRQRSTAATETEWRCWRRLQRRVLGDW
ncbi:hypothetical protein FA15DRAFT_670029 [Coprinopsis marcescibilis]|uniref:Uncharacterized protein n=1 Tax=Coprinopsis marcescibilis TaxID=230819 RepID=A0A5C3KVR5_COPMA|nr:hypothetical protein FA15DRAFT_670029 [Coprinopsis marcescibilis]